MYGFRFLAIAALASAAPAPRASTAPPEALSVSLHGDTQCNVLGGGYPYILNATVCYPIFAEDGIQSLQVYAPPFEGGILTVYATEECEGDGVGSYSTFYVGCQRNVPEGRAIKYTYSS